MKNLLFFLLVMTNSVFAQFKQKDRYIVYVNYPDCTTKAVVLNKTKKVNVKETLTYYWYASNKIIQTKGGFEGKLLSGSYTSFYLSNNLKEKGLFKAGVKDGKWISWHENGKIREITTWKRGMKSGICRQFDSNDQLICESHYKNDKLNGVKAIYENGKRIREVTYKNGLEVIEKPKKEKSEKEVSPELNKETASTDKPKRTFKEKIGYIFKKKEKVTTENQKLKKKKEVAKTDDKSKKTFKEKLNSIFKKKDKSSPPKKTPEPNKSAKQNKTQAAK